ncbi:c2H2-type domain-containing protein [Trichonephila clavipes]|nr:c2H2-type domain-containing protein [Trichonephila clavipes]
MPSDLSLKFNHLNKCVEHRYAIYADFECLLSKFPTTLPNPTKSFTTPIEKHIPVSYAFVVVDYENDILYHSYYAGENVVEKFFVELKEISSKLIAELKRVNKIEVNDSSSYSEYRCVFCCEFFDAKSIRVRHHSHDSNRVLGMAHQLCNLLHRKTFFIPVVIHNSRNYDTHLLLKHLPKNIVKEVSVIPLNMEKLTMFTLDHLKFIDSFQFLDASLDALVRNLSISQHDFTIFEAFFGDLEHRDLLKSKELTFDAGLKFCKVELQLLSEVNDYLFFESNMRGGICLVGKRFAQANNPYIPAYDSSREHSYILALDCVNLYGYAMSMPLPYNNFAWLTPKEQQEFDIFNTSSSSSQGYILEVDLELPPSIHEEQNDLPMAPEHLKISYEMLSPRRRDVQIKVNDWVLVATHPLSSATRKVVAKFKPKFEGPYRVLDVKNNNTVIWKAGKRLTTNVDQVRIYRHRKCDETEIGTGNSDNGSFHDESSGFDRGQRRSNDSRDGKKKGSTIERKAQQGGPVRSRKGRERNDSPYIEERTRSSNKNARRGGDQQRQDQERRGTWTKKSLSLEVLVGNANYKS